MKASEEEAFKDFVKRLGLKSILEYEESRSLETVKAFNEARNGILQKIAQFETETNFINNSLSTNEKSVETLKNILQSEEDKLVAL